MALDLILESLLTCPHCGATSVETMPTDACIYFHECSSCHTLLRPKAEDCLVFCSYGSVKCSANPAVAGLLWGLITVDNRRGHGAGKWGGEARVTATELFGVFVAMKASTVVTRSIPQYEDPRYYSRV